jgi:hypothetical protein
MSPSRRRRDRFTETGTSKPASRIRRAVAAARVSTHWASRPARPASSAVSRNAAGSSTPWPGRRQRSSASHDEIRFVEACQTGW